MILFLQKFLIRNFIYTCTIVIMYKYITFVRIFYYLVCTRDRRLWCQRRGKWRATVYPGAVDQQQRLISRLRPKDNIARRRATQEQYLRRRRRHSVFILLSSCATPQTQSTRRPYRSRISHHQCIRSHPISSRTNNFFYTFVAVREKNKKLIEIDQCAYNTRVPKSFQD